MKAPILTGILFIFIIWLQYEIRKSTRISKKASERFWKKEMEANRTRRKDISSLEYITLDPSLLPLDDKEDDTINSYRDTILKLSNKKIVNLTGITNTELKTRYGIANLELLSEYDNNYTVLISILHKWAERLYTNGFIADAERVLEAAVHYKTDVTKTYKLLADIYLQQNKANKINELISFVEELQIHDKDKLILYLKERISS